MSIFCTGWWYRLSVPAFSLQIQGKTSYKKSIAKSEKEKGKT